MPDPVTTAVVTTIVSSAIASFFGNKGGDLNFVDFLDVEVGLTDALSDYLGNLIWETTGNLDGLVEYYSRRILTQNEDNTGLIINEVNNTESNITKTIIDSILLNHQANKRIEDRIKSTVLGSAGSLENVVAQTAGNIVENIFKTESRTSNQIADIDNRINLGFDRIISDVGSVFDVLARGIVANIENNIILPSDLFEIIFGKINSAIDSVIDGNRHTVDVLGGEIAARLEHQTDEYISITQEQTGVIERVGEQSTDIASETLALEKQKSESMQAAISRLLGIELDASGNIDWSDIPDVFNDAVSKVLFRNPGLSGPDSDCETMMIEAGLLEKTGITVIDWFVSLLTYAMLPLNMSQVRANKEIQNYRLCYPDQLPQPSDIASMYHRKKVSHGEANVLLRQSGYSKNHADLLLSTSRSVPPLEWLFSMYFRNLATEDYAKWSLGAMGYDDATSAAMLEAAFFIPPVQDLITMAVREVFSPEVAKRFGQFEDFPPEFEKYAHMQGVSPEWAKNYWAAHWALPSVQMGYEMLHRRVITEEDLDLLLRAQDVMPFWRDKLKKISYQPLTRIDVRRMHALGVLSGPEVKEAYQDIGYNEENAQRMLDFTIKYNEGSEGGILDVDESLTRSNIISFYDEGVINREVALGLLLKEGLNAIAAELFLRDADLTRERKDRRVKIDIILDRLPTGKATLEEVQRQLEKIGLAPLELERAKQDAERIADKMHKQPSRADLDKFLKAGIIDEGIYREGMVRLGYDDFWIEKFIQVSIGAGNEG